MITVSADLAGTSVRVDGWLAGAGVPELVRVLESAAAPVRILAHDLRGADAAGVSTLRRLAGEGARIDGLSPYMQLLLALPATVDSRASTSPAHPETRVRSDRT
jgi:hypothetical protein